MSGPDWERFGLVDCRPTCAARRNPNAECVCAEVDALIAERFVDYAAAMYGDDHDDPLDDDSRSTVIGQIEHDIARGVSTYGGVAS